MDVNRPSDGHDPWVDIGPHRFADFDKHCEWVPHGTVELAHAEQLVSRLLSHQARVGHIALIVDGRELTPIGADVRGFYVKSMSQVLTRMPIAVFGASLLSRVAQTLAMRAGQLVHRIDVDLRHVDTRQEAVAYIQQRLAVHPRENLS